MPALIGVDIGTQATKAAVFDERGCCLGQASCPSRLHRPQPGVVEEDPEYQVSSVCQAIRRCMREAKISATDVAGLGIDGQMAGIIGIGHDGRHLTPYDSWLDQRCSEQIRHMEREAGEEVLACTGCAPSFNHGPKKLWWKQRRPRVYRRIAAFVQPGAYATMRLCGMPADEAYIDHTYIHFSGFADNQRRQWDDGLCRRFGLDAAKLPRILPPQQIVGQLTRASANRCGLRPGTPVIAGCGDTAASFLACGAVRAGTGVDVAGTASVFAATTTTFRPDHHHRILGCGQSAVPGLWHPYAYINGGGLNLEWFRGRIAAVFGRPDWTLRALDTLAASLKPKRSDPLFVPHLGGRVCPAQPDLRGAWLGLTWSHTGPHLYRAILEAVALEYALYQRVLAQLYPRFRLTELRVTGGGESSRLWNQLKADVLQTPVRRIQRSEGAPRGVAMLAGWGTGVLKDLPTAAGRWVAAQSASRPARLLASHYLQRRHDYERALERLNTPVSEP